MKKDKVIPEGVQFFMSVNMATIMEEIYIYRLAYYHERTPRLELYDMARKYIRAWQDDPKLGLLAYLNSNELLFLSTEDIGDE